MLDPRPPRNQRLINAHYGRDWYDVVQDQLTAGKTLGDIAEVISKEVRISIAHSTLSRWTKHRLDGERQNAA